MTTTQLIQPRVRTVDGLGQAATDDPLNYTNVPMVWLAATTGPLDAYRRVDLRWVFQQLSRRTELTSAYLAAASHAIIDQHCPILLQSIELD